MDDPMRLRWLPFIYCCIIALNFLPLLESQQDDAQQSTGTQRLSKRINSTLVATDWEQEDDVATISDQDNFHAVPKSNNSDTSNIYISTFEEKDEVHSSVEVDPLSKEGKPVVKSSSEQIPSRSVVNDDRSRLLNDADNFRHIMLQRFLQTLNTPSIPGDYLLTNDPSSSFPPASEYMQALFYAVSTDTRLANLPVETHKGEQVVWGIKAFNVTQINVDVIEASFHLALNYEPDIISRVELVLESKIDTHENQKIERTTRATNRHRYYLEACSTPQNMRRNVHNLNKETITEGPYVNETILTNFVIMAGSESVTAAASIYRNSTTAIFTSLDQIRKSQLSLNISKESSAQNESIKDDSKMEKQRENVKDQNNEQPNEPLDCHRFVTGRRRINSKTHEYDVFNATRAFLAWWTDCINKINGSFNLSSSSCRSMLRLIKSGGPSKTLVSPKNKFFAGDALLIIYKNVDADIRKTRRVLKNLPADNTNNLSVSDSNYKSSVSPRSKRIKRNSNASSNTREKTNENTKHEDISTIRPNRLCHLQSWRVDFARMGWTWIISPTSFEANFCTGSCEIGPREFDLVNLTNNAFLRSVYRRLTNDLGVPAPSCVPLRTHPMNILYRRDDETIVLRRVNEITAEECGCL